MSSNNSLGVLLPPPGMILPQASSAPVNPGLLLSNNKIKIVPLDHASVIDNSKALAIREDHFSADKGTEIPLKKLITWKDTRKAYVLPLISLAIIGAGLFAGVEWGHISLDTAVAVGTVGLLTAATMAAVLFIKSMKDKKTDGKTLLGLVPLVAAVASYFIVNHFFNVNLLDKALGGFSPNTIGDWSVLIAGGVATFATIVALAALYNRRKVKEQAELEKTEKKGGSGPSEFTNPFATIGDPNAQAFARHFGLDK